MIQFSQEVIQEVINSILSILRCGGFLVGYTGARMRELGEFFQEIINSIIEGYGFGLDRETSYATT